MTDQLRPIPLVTPGFKGLNTAQASVPDLDPGWAIQCQNFVFDQSGRLASRQGWLSLTSSRLSFAITFATPPGAGSTGGTLNAVWAHASGTGQVVFSDGEYQQATVAAGSTAITWTSPLSGSPTTAANFYPAVGSIAELALANGSTFIVSAMNNQLYSGTTTLTNITGSLTITGNSWQWMTFNGALYGVQAGHPLIMWNGSGNFQVAPVSGAKSFTASATSTTLTVTALISGTPQQGDFITGAGIAPGTYIVSQLTGANGGIGTYQLNQANSFTSETVSVAAGAAPTGGSCGCAAFGRLWILNADNQTLSYCALLDATTWYTNALNPNGAGSINMATVWTRGIDAAQAVAAAGSKLVVFGSRQIIIFADSTGAAVGLNPQNIYVYDTVEGTGCVARDTVQSTGEGDLTFLSPTGVQSLQRLLMSGKDNPVASLDTHIHDYFNSYFLNEVPANIRSAYSPTNRFYLILLPASQRAFCYDTRFKLQGDATSQKLGELPGSLRVTEWPSLTWSSLLNQKASGNVLFGENGQVGQYGGYTDNNNSYPVVYTSPNLALAGMEMPGLNLNFENRIKILKRMKAVLYFGGATVVTFLWGVDFLGLNRSYQVSLGGTLSQYGISQYGIDEYGGGAGLSIQTFPLGNSGRWLQFGVTATINGYQLAIQQLDAYVKIGNMV